MQVSCPHPLRYTRDVLKYTVSAHESAVFFSRKWFKLSESVTDIQLCVHSVDKVCFSRGEYIYGCHFPANPEKHKLEIVFSDDRDGGSKYFH